MFCRESSLSLQTLKITKSVSSLFHKPSAFINPISAGRRDKLPRRGRCKVTASRSNIEQEGTLVKKHVKKIKVKGFITAQEEYLDGITLLRPLDQIADIRGRSLLVELISAETDPSEYIICFL